ncbi:MAG: SH3 domain-containing protein [Chloroflexi bacterium]|nr:SH3 domain-containing protein [Chloroflexota bacterium]
MKKSIFVYMLVAGLILASCNLPEDRADTQEQIMTSAAMTVQSALTTPLASPTASTPIVIVEGATPAMITPTISTTLTSTPSSLETPMANVGDVINCRSGPNKSYQVIAQLLPNQQVQIIGFLPPNYWVVKSQLGDCWLSGEFATPSGNIAAVPTVTAPPTPEGAKPEAPTFPKNGWTFYCYGPGSADITLTWNDKANNETGYRIFRNSELVIDLPANSTNFTETIALNTGQTVSYQIQAYNEIGETLSSVASITCP